jgi:predicted lipoprotein with Yx(FWY)xxD motif
VKKRSLAIAIAGLSVSAVVGGIIIASAGGSGSTQPATAASPGATAITPASGGSSANAGAGASTTATVRTAMARVGGVVEVILVNNKGLPLYIYPPDTGTNSMVNGELAALWPPLLASAPTGSGTAGVLAVVHTGNGEQVTYNGHFLYTFVGDIAGQVSGQGVQNFLVATPSLPPNDATTTPGTTGTTPAPSGTRYAY